MDPIANADHLVLLLRQKLQERARANRRGRSAPPQSSGAPLIAMSAVRQLASVDGVDEHLLRRALVQNLLAEHFGSGLINDAQFQQVISRVTNAIEEDADASQLIAGVLSELRAP